MCLFWTFPINAIIPYTPFGHWLLSLGILFARFTHGIACIRIVFVFHDWIVSHSTYVPHWLHPLISWQLFVPCPLFVHCKNPVFMSKGVFTAHRTCLRGVGLVGHKLIPCLTFWGTAKMFSQVTWLLFIFQPVLQEICNFPTSSPALVTFHLTV